MATELDKILNEPLSSKEELLKHLKEESKVLSNKKIKKAFEDIDRKDFVAKGYEFEAYEDYAIPIGHGQTISQPTTVAFMLELLDVQEGEEILDVGSGSGFTAALLGHIVGESGKVTGIERIPELIEFAQSNISKYNFSHVEILESKDDLGHSEGAPYDKILVSATSSEFPEDLTKQLKIGGIIVVPVQNSIFKVTKKGGDELLKEEYPGFVFVPLVDESIENGE